MKAIEVEKLCKSYDGIKALDGVSFSIEEGEIFGFLGPNGAGKTTAIEILEGYRKPDGGHVRVLGIDPGSDGKELRQRIGIMLQDVCLYPDLKVGEVLGLFGRYYRVSMDPEPLLEQLALSEKRNSLVRELSGGQTRKLGFVISLINDPDLVFLDEPTAGLDAQSRRRVWEFIRRAPEEGKTVFLTTHYIEEAQELCDRVGIIDHGRLITVEEPRKLMAEFAVDHRIEFFTDNDIEEDLAGISEISRIVRSEPDRYVLYSLNPQRALKQLLTIAEEKGFRMRDLRVEGARLEDVFLRLTGEGVR